MKLFHFEEWVNAAIAEDIGPGDITSLVTIPEQAQGSAKLFVKENGIIAGIEEAKRIIHHYDSSLQFNSILTDGSLVQSGDIAFTLHGSSRSITSIERLVLNVMQRMSGIATKTFTLTQKIAHTPCKILDTRKTTPNFRYFEKEAVRIGGGVNHRYALYDMILVKDNHVDFCGDMRSTIEQIRRHISENNLQIPVEIEARTLEDVQLILDSQIAFRVLLDNFTVNQIQEAVKLVNGQIQTEASGGINESNFVAYAETGVDFISMGALTHQIQSLDLSLKAYHVK
ncbi:MAG: carboxylating nicotinate-nucleotide diphosphorylase [Bacteroidota bacterium]|jgi:nicotinate-nucleotide pyrophosphorylase (carboxylating)